METVELDDELIGKLRETVDAVPDLTMAEALRRGIQHVVDNPPVITLNGASPDVDSSKLASAEIGTMVRSVVATGKVEPITKVEIKSKANGIIKSLPVDIDAVVKEGDVLAELDKEQLNAALRGAQANLVAAQAALEAALAQLAKNRVEAEGPDVDFARRALERAKSLSDQRLIAQTAEAARARALMWTASCSTAGSW